LIVFVWVLLIVEQQHDIPAPFVQSKRSPYPIATWRLLVIQACKWRLIPPSQPGVILF